jgi:DNA-binding response OmpR family regulator
MVTLRQLPEFLYADIDEAGNGAIALKKMETTEYDLVLSDIRMPYMDGLEFVRCVRNERRDSKTPIVLLSTLGTEADVERGLAAGADAYLLKPIAPHLIVAALRDFLDQRKAR